MHHVQKVHWTNDFRFLGVGVCLGLWVWVCGCFCLRGLTCGQVFGCSTCKRNETEFWSMCTNNRPWSWEFWRKSSSVRTRKMVNNAWTWQNQMKLWRLVALVRVVVVSHHTHPTPHTIHPTHHTPHNNKTTRPHDTTTQHTWILCFLRRWILCCVWLWRVCVFPCVWITYHGHCFEFSKLPITNSDI